ncbi:MAG: response regulator [Candidatus Cloacimonadales bacterium]|jgi:PAS domain S-box-containing protein|nr:response regulator [Candidatus Cloacimonadota bacterium]MDX9977215.1 response regulator [Candidatus Cloacimonadales bacterium]
MEKSIKILLIEDDNNHYELIAHSFLRDINKYHLIRATTIGNAQELLNNDTPDIILVDLKLPDGDGLEILDYNNTAKLIPTVLLTSFGNEEYAVKAIKLGALDYLVKSPELFQDLPRLTKRFLKDWEILKSIELKDKEIALMSERLKSLLNLTPFAIIEIDEYLNIKYFNKSLLKIFYIKNVNTVSFDKIFAKETKSFVIQQLKKLKLNKEYNRFECTLYRYNNDPFYAQIETVALSNEDNNYLIILTDLTEKKKTEELQIKENKLNSIGHLAAGLAHSFNNILSTIIGNISLSKLSLPSFSEIYKYLDDAEKACGRAKELTNQLLTFSKGGTPMKENVNIQDLVQNAISIAAAGTNIIYQLFFEPMLRNVMVDKQQITQVIQNILINSYDAMPNGGVIKINLENYRPSNQTDSRLTEQDYIKISIKDNGQGISEENLKYIFDPYFTTKEMGDGLGLTTCYSIIKQHNGLIEVESKENYGSTLHIYLPAGERKVIDEKEISKKKQPMLGKSRILVLENEEMVRTMIQKLLKHFNHTVDFVLDCRELFDILKNYTENNLPYDLILTDSSIKVCMNNEDNSFANFKSNYPNIPIIIMSSNATDPIVKNFKENGFAALLIKPFTINDLMRIINSTLQ